MKDQKMFKVMMKEMQETFVSFNKENDKRYIIAKVAKEIIRVGQCGFLYYENSPYTQSFDYSQEIQPEYTIPRMIELIDMAANILKLDYNKFVDIVEAIFLFGLWGEKGCEQFAMPTTKEAMVIVAFEMYKH